jgi:hypothetical protein
LSDLAENEIKLFQGFLFFPLQGSTEPCNNSVIGKQHLAAPVTGKQIMTSVNAKTALISAGQSAAYRLTQDLHAQVMSRVMVETSRKGDEPISIEWAGKDRNAFAPARGSILNTLENVAFPNAIALLVGTKSIDPARLSRIIGNDASMGKGDQFVAVKTLQKLVNLIFTLANGEIAQLSDYSSQILNNALSNGDALSIAGCLASLSRRVSSVDLPNQEQIGSKGRYSPGTAGAQTSQVRDALSILGLASITKGKQGDTMILNPERVGNLRALYAM